jgi:hypothetical protein
MSRDAQPLRSQQLRVTLGLWFAYDFIVAALTAVVLIKWSVKHAEI